MSSLGRMPNSSPLLFMLAALAMGVLWSGCGTPQPMQLAIANGNLLKIVDAETGQTLHDITRYQEVMGLAYRPDGERLAVAICFGNRVVELESSYAVLCLRERESFLASAQGPRYNAPSHLVLMVFGMDTGQI